MKCILSSLLIFCWLWTIASQVSAEIYQWKDENGKIHFGDNKPGHTEFETIEATTTNEISLGVETVKTVDKTPEEFYKSFERKIEGDSDRLIASSKYNYYDIYVRKKEEISKTALRTSPIAENGQKFLAHTTWRVDWTHQVNRLEDNVCALKSHNITLKVTYQMPRLVTQDMERAESTAIQNNWREFYTILMEHENGHMQNGIDAANEVNKFFNGLYGRKYNCSSLREGVVRDPNEIIESYNERDKSYDTKTQHGMKQGADISGYF